MTSNINTRLAVLDALAYPIGLAVFVLSQGDQIGGAHGLALVGLGIWAVRKLGWALDGYREPAGERWIAFNPFNPVSVALAGVLVFLGPKSGPYSYTTTTLLVWALAFLAFGGMVKLFA